LSQLENLILRKNLNMGNVSAVEFVIG